MAKSDLLAWVFCSFSLLLVNSNSQGGFAFPTASPIHLGRGILPLISPFSAFPALFLLQGKGQGRMWGVTGVRENRRYLSVLSKEMLDIPSQGRPLKPELFPYGERGAWQVSREGICGTKPSVGWRWSQEKCSEERISLSIYTQADLSITAKFQVNNYPAFLYQAATWALVIK